VISATRAPAQQASRSVRAGSEGSLRCVPDALPFHRPTARHKTLAGVAALVGLPSPGIPDVSITGVTLDSRDVQPGDLWAALPGANAHGAAFVEQAANRGAAAVLTDFDGLAYVAASGLPTLVVDDPRGELGSVAAWVYDDPSNSLLCIGVTGTNGKTTTTFLIYEALRQLGRAAGLIGTLGTRLNDDSIATARTTPEAPDVHALLAIMRDRSIGSVAMEVSSHALTLGRVDAVHYDVAVFTNLSPDHLDFHGTMEDYFEAKATLFDANRTQRAVICIDDKWGQRLARRVRAAGQLDAVTYSSQGDADWRATDVDRAEPGITRVGVAGRDGSGHLVSTSLDVAMPGDFNVSNAIAALATLVSVGVNVSAAAASVSAATQIGVPGRMQWVDGGDIRGVVDYAHTPDAVERALIATRAAMTDGAALICVLGCGGDRDRGKRPVMGEVAARLVDVLVVTDDNPRSEVPQSIRDAIRVGAEPVAAQRGIPVFEIGDRREAIAHAVSLAKRGDVVAVLGKGHERGQEVSGVVSPFADDEVLRDLLATAKVGES